MSPIQVHDFVNFYCARSRSGHGLAEGQAARTQFMSYLIASGVLLACWRLSFSACTDVAVG